MKSVISEAIGLSTHPVAIIWAGEAPQGAIRFRRNVWGCVASALATAAARGRAAAFDRETYGCWGGGVGLGFGNCYEQFPAGIDGFCGFLSSGNADSPQAGAIAEQMTAAGWRRMAEDYLHGEGYQRDPETVRGFLASLPIRDIPERFVVFKPLEQAEPEKDDIKSVTFFVDPDRLAALVILANYACKDGQNVIVPWAAGCQVPGIFAYRELERERPRGLIGLTDISARQNVRGSVGANVMSFTAPWPLFQEMERNVAGGFLERETWRGLRTRSS
jgi:uncharacterized protein (DUF169 family)